MIKKCKLCNKQFKSRKETEYCSKKCYFKYRKSKTRETKSRICSNCGKIYFNYQKPRNKNINFCSKKCWAKFSKGTNLTSNFGKKNPAKRLDVREKLREAKLENKNPMWKGDNVGYNQLHNWIRTRKPKPALCGNCGIKKPYDLANISGNYKRDVNDFEWICRSCHMKKESKLKNLKNQKVRNDEK